MTIGIYAIYDTNTSICLYVGQSQNIESRFKRHVRLLKSKSHSSKEFIDWFNENNCEESKMKLVILEECINDDSIKNKLEIKWFNNLNPLFYGKKPSSNETWKQTRETREKIRDGVIRFHEKQGTAANFTQTCLNCNSVFERKKSNFAALNVQQDTNMNI